MFIKQRYSKKTAKNFDLFLNLRAISYLILHQQAEQAHNLIICIKMNSYFIYLFINCVIAVRRNFTTA